MNNHPEIKIDQLSSQDTELAQAIDKEWERQQQHLELIASENYTYPMVMAIQGSCLTNKYAEGYPGKRYYGGCEFVDQAEQLAIDRLKKLFNVDYANVQPHSGSQANLITMQALLNHGDKILALSLTDGGHLSHGSKVHKTGTMYEPHFYNLNDEGEIDYNDVLEKAKSIKPKLIIAGYSAYSRTIDWKKFSEIAKAVDAYLLADIAHISGLIAAGLHPSPVGYADVITSTTHKTLKGPRGGIIMCNNNPEIEKN